MITKETPLGEIKGYYRSTLVAALKCYTKAIAKARKDEEEIDGVTDHLDDRDEIVDELRACLGARTAEQLADTPIGKAMAEGETKHQAADLFQQPDQLEPDGVDLMDDSVITMMLEIIHYDAQEHLEAIAAAVKTWDQATRRDVYRWSRAMQLEGIGATHVVIPPRPAVVLQEWLSSWTVRDIEEGKVDPETMAPLADMPEDEIGRWVETGPWGPIVRVTKNGTEPGITVWSLVWNGPLGEGDTAPSYAYEHPDEADARRVAAVINRRIAAERGLLAPAAPIGFTEAEIARLLELGPWAPRVVDGEEGVWSIEWTAALDEDEVAPTRTDRVSETEARVLAAMENKKVAEFGQPGEDNEKPDGAPPAGGMEEIGDDEGLRKSKRSRKRKPKSDS